MFEFALLSFSLFIAEKRPKKGMKGDLRSVRITEEGKGYDSVGRRSAKAHRKF